MAKRVRDGGSVSTATYIMVVNEREAARTTIADQAAEIARLLSALEALGVPDGKCAHGVNLHEMCFVCGDARALKRDPLFVAGITEGMERAAKIADDYAKPLNLSDGAFEAANDLATAIRNEIATIESGEKADG